MVAHAYNPSTWEAKARDSCEFKAQPRLRSLTLSQDREIIMT